MSKFLLVAIILCTVSTMTFGQARPHPCNPTGDPDVQKGCNATPPPPPPRCVPVCTAEPDKTVHCTVCP
jgi:hypothetical protein